MVKSVLKKSVLALPIEDRIDLFDDLLESIAADGDDIQLQKWQEALFGQRIAQYEANPKDVLTFAQFKYKTKALERELKSKSGKNRK